MNLIRLYKIKQLGISISKDNMEMIDYLESRFDDLYFLKSIDSKRTIYYNITGTCIFETILYEPEEYSIGIAIDLWDVLEHYYKINENMIIEIFKYWIIMKYDLSILDNVNTIVYSTDRLYMKTYQQYPRPF